MGQSPPQLTRSDPDDPLYWKRKAAEWEAIAVRNLGWALEQLEAQRERYALQLAEKDARIQRLRDELAEEKGLKSRRSDNAPSLGTVHSAYVAKLKHCQSKKEAELALAEEFRCDVRTIRRRLLEFNDLLKRVMAGS